MKKTIDNLNIEGKVVFLREDFNVPMKKGKITSSLRIKAALPTINKVIKEGGKLVILSHLGRINSEEDRVEKSLKPVAKELAQLIDKDVLFVPFTRGSELEYAIKKMKNSEIILMENTRFEDINKNKESKNNKNLAKYWAKLADVFINDAFGTSHRKHASNVGIATYVKESAIGYLVQSEIQNLSKAIFEPKKPVVAIFGGAKVSDKIQVINNFLSIADKILICGGMAYTFLKAQGIGVGNSLVEEDKIELASNYLKNHLDKFVLPIDSAYASSFKNEFRRSNKENPLEIPKGFMGLDIGNKTIKLFKKEIEGAKTVIWNGPAGVTEFSNFALGTLKIANTIASLDDAYTILGGGDLIAAVEKLKVYKKFSHISTGGGASLQFLSGQRLPGIDVIQNFVMDEEVPEEFSDVIIDENKIIQTEEFVEHNENDSSSTKLIEELEEIESVGLVETPKGHVKENLEEIENAKEIEQVLTDEFETIEVEPQDKKVENAKEIEQVSTDEFKTSKVEEIKNSGEIDFDENGFEFTNELEFDDDFVFEDDEPKPK